MKQVLKRVFLGCLLVMLAVVPAFTVREVQAEAAASTTTKLKKPSGLSLTQYLNRGFAVKWKAVKNVTGYEIYLRTAEGKKYTKIGKTKTTAFQVKNLKKVNKGYVVAVRAYKKLKGGKYAYSDFATLAATSYQIDIEEIHGRYVQATTRTTTTITFEKSGKKKVIGAGTRLTATARNGNYNTVLYNGQKATISRSTLSFGNLVTTNQYYTTAQKELYINGRGFSSPTNYFIWVNQYTLNTTVFKGSKGKWKVIRSMPCVVGRYGKTPVGLKKIERKGYLYGSYALYYTWTGTRGNAFHCRMSDGLSRAAASGGCIRLGYEDLKFLYDTCPVGTTVLSY